MPNLQNADGTLTAKDIERAKTLLYLFASVFTINSNDEAFKPAVTQVSTFGNYISFLVARVRKELDLWSVANPGWPDLVYEVGNCTEEPMSHIFQLSWDTCKIPIDWKEAKISATYKNWKMSNTDNYWLVSLTSVSWKIMEGINHEEIMLYLSQSQFRDKKQYGFLAGKSTQLQLLSATDR